LSTAAIVWHQSFANIYMPTLVTFSGKWSPLYVGLWAQKPSFAGSHCLLTEGWVVWQICVLRFVILIYIPWL